MVVGICNVTLRLSSVSSLKGKRQIVKKVIARSKNRFNVSIAEVGCHDEWKKAEIGFAAVGKGGSFVNSVLDKVLDYIEDLDLAEIIHVDMEIVNV